jgi:ribosome-associated protein
MDGEIGIDVGRGVRFDPGAVTWRFSTAGGPGGQHVNTSNTRAEATLDLESLLDLPDWARQRLVQQLGPTITTSAGDTRSQSRNRDLALDRLAQKLRAALAPPPPPRRPTRPTRASKRRRLDDKRRRAQLKQNRQRHNPTDD